MTVKSQITANNLEDGWTEDPQHIYFHRNKKSL